MGSGLSDPGSLQQRLTLRTGWKLVGLVFELGGLFGHSFFKGSGLLYSTALSHGALLDVSNDSHNEMAFIQFQN